jgi:hypothetical protein
MAETRTINLEIKDNFKKVEKDIDDLNKSLKDTAENNRDVSKTFEEVYGEIQPLTARMGEAEDRLYELAAAGDTASKEYRDLLQTVGEYRKVQIQTDMAVDAASTTLGQKLGGALGGVTSGFSLAQGAFAAFGDESKEVEEALLKVQSAMAIQQGLQGIKEAIPSFKALGTVIKSTSVFQGLLTAATAAYTFVTTATTTGLKLFRIALISTGIGAIIVGVGLLVANFDKVKAAVMGAVDRFKGLSGTMKTVLSIMFPVIGVIRLVNSALESMGIIDSDQDKAREENAKKEAKRREEELKQLERMRAARELAFNNEQKALDRLIAIRSAEGKSVDALTKQKIKGSIDYQKELQKEMEASLAALELLILRQDTSTAIGRLVVAETQKVVDEIKAKNEEAKNSILDSENELKIADINAKKEAQNRNKAAVDNAKQTAQDLRNLKRQIQDEEIKAIEDVNQREQTQLIVSAQRRIEDLSLTAKDKKKNAKLITEIQNNLNKDLDKLDEKFYEAQRKAQEDANNNKIRLQREFDNIIEQIDEDNFQAGLQKSMTEDEYALELVRQKYFNLEELAKGNAEQLASIETAKALEIEAIEKKANEKSIAEAKAVAEQKAAIQQQGLDTALQGVQLIKGLFEKSKGVQKAAVIAESAIGIAKMIISNKLANAGALATPQAIATSGAAAVPVIALNNISTGIGIAANIAATAKALKSLGGGSAPSAPADGGGGGGGGGGGASTTPQFNTIGSSGVNQLAQLQQQPVQAYVVSGDVTSAQSLDRNRIQNATL